MRFAPALFLLAASAIILGGACSRSLVIVPEAKAAEPASVAKGDWPMFGGGGSRNFGNTVEKNVPDQWNVAKGKEKGVKWKAVLSGTAMGGPVVAGGRVFIGTNNDKPFDKNVTGDKGVVVCFDEATGKFLWQITHDKLDNPEQDYGHEGVVSTPTVVGNRVYYGSA